MKVISPILILGFCFNVSHGCFRSPSRQEVHETKPTLNDLLKSRAETDRLIKEKVKNEKIEVFAKENIEYKEGTASTKPKKFSISWKIPNYEILGKIEAKEFSSEEFHLADDKQTRNPRAWSSGQIVHT